MEEIPFNQPYLSENEVDYIRQALRSGQTTGNGPFTHKAQALLEKIVGVPRAYLTTSCTAALEMAALLLDIKEGDEVILPAYTFVSTANAFLLRGARPVFIDIRPDTLNLDETLLEAKISPRTKAVIPVHYAGVGCDMEKIGAICKKYQIAIVEDNAHGLFGKYRGQSLGSFGDFAALSFHGTKNISCGEGGALLIKNPHDIERAEIIRDKGTNRGQYYRGEVDSYSWVDLGSSFLMSDVLAAVLCAQLEAREKIQATRQRIWNYYQQELQDWAQSEGVRLSEIPPECESGYHVFYAILPSSKDQRRFLEFLKERGINASFHYTPLHTSKMGQKYGGRQGDCPVAEDLAHRMVRLPIYVGLEEGRQSRVVETIRQFTCQPNRDYDLDTFDKPVTSILSLTPVV